MYTRSQSNRLLKLPKLLLVTRQYLILGLLELLNMLVHGRSSPLLRDIFLRTPATTVPQFVESLPVQGIEMVRSEAFLEPKLPVSK